MVLKVGGSVNYVKVFSYNPINQEMLWEDILVSKQCVSVFVFNISPTAKVIQRWGHDLNSYPTDCY